MGRLTKAQQGETTRVYYGINSRTCEIEMVFEHRDRILTNHSANPSRHYVSPSYDVEHEIRLVWHLTDLIWYTPGSENDAWAKQQIAELKGRAAQMKAERGARLPGGQ